MESKFTILVVDDVPSVRFIIRKVLANAGFSVIEADSCQTAEEQIHKNSIDLILLDVMLPDGSGYDLCKKIKLKDEFKVIPVIFITGSEDSKALDYAYKAGGVDFIPKPVSKGALTMRIQSHLNHVEDRHKIAAQHQELMAYQGRLVQEEKTKAFSQMIAGLTHELNNPIAFLNSNNKSLKTYLRKLETYFKEAREVDEELYKKQKIAFILKDLPDIIEENQSGFARIDEIMSQMADIEIDETKQEATPNCLKHCLNNALTFLKQQSHNVQIDIDTPDEAAIAKIHSPSITQVLVSLIDNAIHAVKSKNDAQIQISIKKTAEEIELRISDNGCGIAEDKIDKIFDPFYTTRNVGEGKGLGLYSAREIIHNHRATISVESTLGIKSQFTLRFPLVEA
mgnify:CR=1 FL=1